MPDRDRSTLRVMTFNVRYDEPADGRHAWRHRKDAVLAMLRDHDPDLLGLQEPLANQWEEIAEALPDHSPFGVVADESGEPDPRGGFVRTSRFAVRDHGSFWLSDTPEIPHSFSWPTDWGARACAWALLHDRHADRELLFANTHLDPNPGFWLPAATVLHAELDSLTRGAPIVLTGDFNTPSGSAAHQYLCTRGSFRDAWSEAGRESDGVITYHAFDSNPRVPSDAPGNYRIDWILFRGPFTCRSASVDVRQGPGGLMPSDHYPVIATIEWDRALHAERPDSA